MIVQDVRDLLVNMAACGTKLNFAELACLVFIPGPMEDGEISLADIADEIFYTKPVISRSMAFLRQRKLVSVEVSKEDKRRLKVKRTRAGDDLLGKLGVTVIDEAAGL